MARGTSIRSNGTPLARATRKTMRTRETADCAFRRIRGKRQNRTATKGSARPGNPKRFSGASLHRRNKTRFVVVATRGRRLLDGFYGNVIYKTSSYLFGDFTWVFKRQKDTRRARYNKGDNDRANAGKMNVSDSRRWLRRGRSAVWWWTARWYYGVRRPWTFRGAERGVAAVTSSNRIAYSRAAILQINIFAT